MQETKLKLLERIVDRRQDSLYRFAYIRTGSQADAEDIVQDVLLRLFHSDCNLDRIDDVERYLWRAIANRCCDYHRHRRNATLPTERAAALADDSGDQELREEYERIAGLLATLPEEQAEVIRLKTSDSLTFARIAEIHRHHRGDRQIPFPLRDRQAPQTHQPLKIIRHEMHRF